MSRETKRLPKEVQAMFDGGTALLQITIALVMAIVKKGGTASQLHALTKSEGTATIERMVDAFFGTVAHHFPTWKTITLGTHKSVADLRTALEQGNFKVGDWASQILAKVTLASQETTIELVRVTGAQLGQTANETLGQICVRAKKYGLARCPAEVGPQLRHQYNDQPIGEVVWVAMDSIAGSYGSPRVFCVERDEDDQWLRTNDADPGCVWDPGGGWVFVRGKQ